MNFPFHEIEFPEVLMSDHWSFHQFYGYITTWSAFRAFEAAGGAKKINLFREQLANVWKNPDDAQKIRWALSLRVGLVD